MADSELSREIRAMVRAAIAEALPKLAKEDAPGAADGLAALGSRGEGEATVRIASDQDLTAFARELAGLLAHEKGRRGVLEGRIRFRLAREAAAPAQSAAPAPAGPAAPTAELNGRQVEITGGMVNERKIAAIAEGRDVLVVSPDVVVTPLARDKARARGLKIVRKGA